MENTMENTNIVLDAAKKNAEVAPVIDQVAKHSVNVGEVAGAVAGVAVAGYIIWKVATKVKEFCDAKKAEKDAIATEHEFCVESEK